MSKLEENKLYNITDIERSLRDKAWVVTYSTPQDRFKKTLFGASFPLSNTITINKFKREYKEYIMMFFHYKINVGEHGMFITNDQMTKADKIANEFCKNNGYKIPKEREN